MSIEILNKPSIKDWIIENLAARKASGGGAFTLALSDEKLKDLEEAKEDLKNLGFGYSNPGKLKSFNPETQKYKESEESYVTFSGPSL